MFHTLGGLRADAIYMFRFTPHVATTIAVCSAHSKQAEQEAGYDDGQFPPLIASAPKGSRHGCGHYFPGVLGFQQLAHKGGVNGMAAFFGGDLSLYGHTEEGDVADDV